MITTPAADRRFSDGAYCAHGERDLFRCLGARLPSGPADQTRIGFENASDPGDVRWVRPTSLFAQRLRFITQGEPTTDRETVEAMR